MIFELESESCATPTKVSCIPPLDTALTTEIQIIKPANKRGRGRPKQLKGKFVTNNMHDY